jgi:hypothetical protein
MTNGVDLIEDETTLTEITIQPDGRVYIFGTSRQVLDILVDLDPRSARLRRLLGEVKRYESGRANGTEAAIATATRRD